VAQCGETNCDAGVIIGLDGGAQWTSATHPRGLQLSPEEGAAIAKCFKANDMTQFQANGVRLGGQKYQFLRVQDDKIVFAKKKEHGALTLQASKTAIIIARCPEGGQQGNTNKGVAVIAEYLESVGM